MTRVSPITKGLVARFPGDGEDGRLGAVRSQSGLRPGILRETGRRRTAGGAGALGVSVTTSGEMLIDW
jgi:hypothetical protein